MSEQDLNVKLEEMNQKREQWQADHDQRDAHWASQRKYWDGALIVSVLALFLSIIFN